MSSNLDRDIEPRGQILKIQKLNYKNYFITNKDVKCCTSVPNQKKKYDPSRVLFAGSTDTWVERNAPAINSFLRK
jgi:hypothetical protein